MSYFVLGIAGVVLSAQTPTQQQTPTFRSGTTVVPLTVTVLDRMGAPVMDLKASDFTVIENKSPREIVNFFPQALKPGPVPQHTDGPVNRVRDNSVAPQTRRTFLIVLGYGRIQHPTNALDGAMEFVRKRLLPQDAVALMAFHRATTFTTDHEKIAQILERYKKAHEKIVFEINEFRLFSRSPYGGTGGAPIPEKFLKMIDAVFTGPALAATGTAASSAIPLRHAADMLLGMDRIVPVVDKPWQQQTKFADLQRGLSNNGDELADEVLLGTGLKMAAGVEYLRYMDGAKHMLVLANGVGENLGVVKRATDARVVVDFVATNGTAAPRRGGGGGGGGSASGREIAEQTGGYYTSVEMAGKAVAKIDQATRFSYLLGYAPSNPTLDGRYRDVEVKVNRPDVTVSYSHGYYAAAEPEPLALKELIVKSRLETLLAYDSQARDIKLGVVASLLPRMGIQVSARVEITIDASQLAFDIKDGIRRGDLELQVYCGDAKQVVVGEFGERLELQASEETYAEWLRTGIRHVIRVPALGTPKYVKVVVYDYGSDRAGSVMFTLK